MHLSERIFEERDKRGWSQARLAEEAGISQTTVVHLENDKQTPRRTTLRRLAKALDLPLDELLSEVGEGKVPTPLRDLSLEQRRLIFKMLGLRGELPLMEDLRELARFKRVIRSAGLDPDSAEFRRWFRTADLDEVRDKLLPEVAIEEQTLTGV